MGTDLTPKAEKLLAYIQKAGGGSRNLLRAGLLRHDAPRRRLRPHVVRHPRNEPRGHRIGIAGFQRCRGCAIQGHPRGRLGLLDPVPRPGPGRPGRLAGRTRGVRPIRTPFSHDMIQTQSKIVHPGGFTGGIVRVPGDKSISHRTALLAGISSGVSTISGFLQAEDCLNTLKAMEAFGARSWFDEDGILSIQGTGGKMLEPAGPLDVGNSGTGMRLLAGLCAGSPITVTLSGDESLNSRPMRRIQEPLERMGAKIDLTDAGTAPMTIHGGSLHGIEYCLPVNSAQVKSCCILAGLYADGTTTVVEPVPTRDHTERMLRAVGAPIKVDGPNISIQGYGAKGPKFLARPYVVPGDFSSAAYWLAAAAAIPATGTMPALSMM